MKVFSFYARRRKSKIESSTVYFRSSQEVLEEVVNERTVYIYSDEELLRQKLRETKLRLIK